MKIAIPLWQGRVSPVFDVASNILLVDISNRREWNCKEICLTENNPFERAQLLHKLEAELLICGMLSQLQKAALASFGIRIIPHICGQVEDVISEFIAGRLNNGALLMPGCGNRRSSLRCRHRWKEKH